MFEKSSTLAAPPRSRQPLWRYLAADRLKDLLRSNELFFNPLSAFDDSKEGALTARTREHLATWYQLNERLPRLKAYEQVDEYSTAQRFFYVNCWHMNDHESYLMWKAYAERGYAVVTTYERLTAAMSGPATIMGGVVSYIDFERELTDVGNVFNHVAVKDMPYRDEREFRLVFWDVEPHNAGYPKVSGGVRVPIDVKMLIDRVVRSPYAEPMDSELEQLLLRYGIEFDRSVVIPRPKTKP
jgi:hypothetical protein